MLRSMTSSFSPAHFVSLLALGLVAAACSGDDEPAGDASAGGTTSGGQASDAGRSSSGRASNDAGKSAAGEPNGVGVAGAESGQLVLAPVLLGTAENYAIVAKSKISNVPTSVVTGDLGLSPAAASYVTGFALTKAGTSFTSPQVTGKVFAADNDPPTPARLTTAVADMLTAYADAAGRKSPDFVELGAGAIGGLTLEPGLYKWTSSVTIPKDVTLSGSEDDVWIFQVSGDLALSSARSVILSGGAAAKNVFWQVAGGVDFGTDSHAEGVVLCKTAIELESGASINGRLLAQTAVNLSAATVVAP
jgi:hypothetical protein